MLIPNNGESPAMEEPDFLSFLVHRGYAYLDGGDMESLRLFISIGASPKQVIE